jgi:D-glucosaminate-6-phosphate ammonia-lyase
MPGMLGVRRVINASGIYTDLGGSVLSERVWAAASAANGIWMSLPELLDASGARVARLCGAPAARVVPGASAGIALSVGACIARGDGRVGEALPLVDSIVLMQRAHASSYAYARCAALAGARVEFVDDLADALSRGGACAVLHPAHLNDAGDGIDVVTRLARAAGVPVVVDAAFMSYPLSSLEHWSAAGDVACFSAKYFFGPNAGGFVVGAAGMVADVAALDFTEYESGSWRTFGRAFKLDRFSVVATVAALEDWVRMDHGARLFGYSALAGALGEVCGSLPGAEVELGQFTVDERWISGGPVNAVLVRGRDPVALSSALAARDPSVRAIALDDGLMFCCETVRSGEVDEIGVALRSAWPALNDG